MRNHHVAVVWQIAIIAAGIFVVHFIWQAIFSLRPLVGIAPVSDDDPVMIKAVEHARATVDGFLSMFPDHRKDSMVKFRFTTDAGLAEHLWADLLEVKAGRAIIYVRTPPVSHKGTMERKREIGLDEIRDWQIDFPDGTIRGGYTTRAAFKIMERDNRSIPTNLRKQLSRFREIDGAMIA